MKLKAIFIIIFALVLSTSAVYAACSVDLDLQDPQDEYEPYDYINVTAEGGYPGEGSVIFYVINQQDLEVGRTESIGLNSTGHANAYFMVGTGWAKGTYKIKVDYSKGRCSTTKIIEVMLDTNTIPVNMDIAANFSLTNISQCQNVTAANVTYKICMTGQVPTGFDWHFGKINTSKMQEELGNITVHPQRPYYPFEFVKEIQDRMTDSIFQKIQIVDSNSRMSNTILNLSIHNMNLTNQIYSLQNNVIQQQITYWQGAATQCWSEKNDTISKAKSKAKSTGFWTGGIIFFFIGLIVGVLAVFLYIWNRSRGDDLGGGPPQHYG